LYRHAVKLVTEELFAGNDQDDGNIFTRWRRLIRRKVAMQAVYPEVFDFLLSAAGETDSNVQPEIESDVRECIRISREKLFENIDTRCFRPGIDVSRAMHAIFWTLEGYSNQVTARLRAGESIRLNSELESMQAEAEAYLALLEKAFCG
jgi:hypothetical protein